MLEITTQNKNVKINNKDLTYREGGFSDNQPCVLVDDIAIAHECTLKYLNELIRHNIDMFNKDDIIDIFQEDLKLAKEMLGAKSRRTELFLFSESGYIKLVSLMKNSKKKKEIMNEFISNYFIMREHLQNIAKMDPDLFINTLPNMAHGTIEKYILGVITAKNIDEIVPRIITRLKGLKSDSGRESGINGSKKLEILSTCIRCIDTMKDNADLKIYDICKIDDYNTQLRDYRHTVIAARNGGLTKKYNDTKEELKFTKEELKKIVDEKSVIEKPIINEENKYEDLLRSFKVYRNYLSKTWDMGMEEVCNDYYDLIPVKLPMATECQKLGYKSKFEYCYAYYPDDTKIMVNKMYRDCVANGYLERKK